MGITTVQEFLLPDIQEGIEQTELGILDEGDDIVVYAKRTDDCIKASVTVEDVRASTDETDDVVFCSDGIKLRLQWNPAEPNVGIPREYAEPPIILSGSGVSEEYEVHTIIKE